MRRNAVIVATGGYLPSRKLPNQYFNELMGEDVDQFLRKTLQIYERRWCEDYESTADLAVGAAQIALDRAGVSPKELDLIIVATDTPEYLSPSTASVVQFRLNAGHAGTFDLNSACVGFITALDVGSKYIQTDHQYKYVLVIGAYVMSKFMDPKDKRTATLFADGAGAVLLKAEDNTDRGFLRSKLITLGQYYDGMGIYAGGARKPISYERIVSNDHLLKINYRFPPTLNPQMWTRMAKELCEELEVNIEDISHFFLTQININSIHKTLDNLEVDYSKAHTTMHHYAYTGSASIPITLDDAIAKDLIQKNDLIFFIGSGGGLSFGAVAVRF